MIQLNFQFKINDLTLSYVVMSEARRAKTQAL